MEDSLKVRVDLADEFRGFGTGGGYVTAKKGYKFIGVYVYISNPEKEPITYNLTEVYLLDTVSKVKSEVSYVMGTGPFTSFKEHRGTIKAGKEIYLKLVFGVPKDFDSQYLLYRNSLVAIDKLTK